MDVTERVLDAVGRAMGRFAMLRPGDRVAVGVSRSSPTGRARRSPTTSSRSRSSRESLPRPSARSSRSWRCTTLALGHTADDCAEALLRNILFNGRIASLPPVAVSRKGTLRLVRPSVRGEIRAFLATLRGRHPGVAESVVAALGNVNPYTLFDPALEKPGADLSPAFESP
jgi:hypothetical protein